LKYNNVKTLIVNDVNAFLRNKYIGSEFELDNSPQIIKTHTFKQYEYLKNIEKNDVILVASLSNEHIVSNLKDILRETDDVNVVIILCSDLFKDNSKYFYESLMEITSEFYIEDENSKLSSITTDDLKGILKEQDKKLYFISSGVLITFFILFSLLIAQENNHAERERILNNKKIVEKLDSNTSWVCNKNNIVNKENGYSFNIEDETFKNDSLYFRKYNCKELEQ